MSEQSKSRKRWRRRCDGRASFPAVTHLGGEMNMSSRMFEIRRCADGIVEFTADRMGRFSSALLVVREHLPSGKACLRLNIDATRIGNIARFVNHSCDGGNLSTKLVRSSGALFPRLCFFASKDIPVDEELTFSYGEIRKRSKGLPCFCNSPSCVGTLPSEDT
ncbi:hypothetical protein ACSQ67_008686 [Phaseolus vulgaris]